MLENHIELRILQNNLHKSKARTHSILNDPDTAQHYNILMLQEQHWSEYTNSSPIHHAWTMFEPTTADKPPRSAIYIRKTITAFQIETSVKDVTAIQIPTEPKPTLIVNIYKPSDETTISAIHQSLQAHLKNKDYDTIIIGGDFNLHHPLWNPEGYLQQDDEAETLIDMMTDMNLNLLLPPGTITFPDADTTIDLVWGNDSTVERTIKCQIAEGHDHGSDHLPIQTIIATPTSLTNTTTHSTPPFDFMKTDWNNFNDKLKKSLPPPISPNAPGPIIDKFAENIIKALHDTIQETTPRKNSCPHSKRWWTETLTTLRREANRQRNKYRRSRYNADKRKWREKDNKLKMEIRRAKEQH